MVDSGLVFISYATLDKEAVSNVMAGLEHDGIRCWFAPRDIQPADNYHGKLVEALDCSAVVLLFLSNASNASIDVLSEIAHADLKARQIVVVVLDNAEPSNELRPLLVGCERIEIGKETPEGDDVVKSAVRKALLRSRVSRKSKVCAMLLSVVPGAGLIFIGLRRTGFALAGLAALTLGWAYFLELGTLLDKFLACFFFSVAFCSIQLTAHSVLGSVSGSMNRTRRWLPYVASTILPASGVSYAGRRKSGWILCWLNVIALALAVCSGTALTYDRCCLDGCLMWITWLVGIAESGFEDESGRHRNPWIYTLVVFLIFSIVWFNVCPLLKSLLLG